MTSFIGERSPVKRLAVVSYHSSPLLEPGSGDSGGMTVYVRRLAESLARCGIRTDIYTRATGAGPRIVALGEAIRVISIDAGPRRRLEKDRLHRFLGDFVSGVRAFAAAQRLRYDIVHSHYWQSGVAGVDLAEAWGAPLVHSHHTLGKVKNAFLAAGDHPEPVHRLAGEQRMIDAADILICSTDEECQQLACLYGASHDRLRSLHPGVDHATFRPGDRDRARRALRLGDHHTILYVGRIQPLKGLELGVRAVKELVDALDRDVVFLIVGGASGPGGEAEMERLNDLAASLDIRRNVRFMGTRPHHAVADFYRAADIVVVCSHSESFGLAALEGHACATPVVGTAVGGLSYVVKDGESGFLVDTRDPSVFAGRLKTLLSDPDMMNSFGQAAFRSALRFSWEKTAASTQELYECLVEEEPAEACIC